MVWFPYQRTVSSSNNSLIAASSLARSRTKVSLDQCLCFGVLLLCLIYEENYLIPSLVLDSQRSLWYSRGFKIQMLAFVRLISKAGVSSTWHNLGMFLAFYLCAFQLCLRNQWRQERFHFMPCWSFTPNLTNCGFLNNSWDHPKQYKWSALSFVDMTNESSKNMSEGVAIVPKSNKNKLL